MVNLVRFWILLSTLLVGAGWGLSAIHQLNRTGYAFVLLSAAAWWWLQRRKTPGFKREEFCRWRRKFLKRFCRRAPQLYLLTAGLSFLGGCLYPPLNFDANAYRLPRVMHWLWAGQWHWIHTFDSRMNIAACGMEWLSAPLILFSHTDRLLFLINWVSYLLLPGLLFSVFTRLQVRPRTAWWWMWLTASGLCFALQAGSVANDGFAAVYALAAVDLALRAAKNDSVADLWLSLLAAALVTGTKQSNIPLAALWLIAAWPARNLLWRNLPGTAALTGIAVLVSVVPISLLNHHFAGEWMPLATSGLATLGSLQLNPFWGVVGNAFCITVQNLVPPFYSWMPPFHSDWPVLWNEGMRHFLQTSFGAHFISFERFGFLSEVYHSGVSEENAGLGLGVGLMVLATFQEIRSRRKITGLAGSGAAPGGTSRFLRLAPWGLLVIFMARNGAFENARQLAPYYPFLLVDWLTVPGQAQATRVRSWQHLALATMAVAVLLVAALIERPIFPARTIFRMAQSHVAGSEFLADECTHYLDSSDQVIRARRDFINRSLPAAENPVGYDDRMVSADEPGLWLPYGRRRVECLLPDDSPEGLRSQGIHYVVVDASAIGSSDRTIGRWLSRFHATLVDQYTFPKSTGRTGDGPDLYVVRLN